MGGLRKVEAEAVEIPAGAGVAGVKVGAGGPAEAVAEVEGGALGCLCISRPCGFRGARCRRRAGRRGALGGPGKEGRWVDSAESGEVTGVLVAVAASAAREAEGAAALAECLLGLGTLRRRR